VAILKTIEDSESGMRWVAGGVDCLFKPNFAGCNGSLAEKRLVHLESVLRRPTPHDR
jgi:hypothetical protein